MVGKITDFILFLAKRVVNRAPSNKIATFSAYFPLLFMTPVDISSR